MTQTPATAPRRILLATDLSCRCDRAFDRAVALARLWDAELIVAHAVKDTVDILDMDNRHTPSWRRGAAAADLARERLERDLSGADVNSRIVLEIGEAAALIAAIVERERCDLIVTGVARDETLGRWLLGGTVDRLVRTSAVPVLVVRDRFRGAYEKIAVGTDFSPSSSQAFSTAAVLFPEAAFTLLYGYEAPYGSFSEIHDSDFALRNMENKAGNRFLESTDVPPEIRSRTKVVVEHITPERLLRAYARDHGADLIVIGSHGRSAMFNIALGSTARRVLETATSDVLLVRVPPH